jgi:hypothetical protein
MSPSSMPSNIARSCASEPAIGLRISSTPRMSPTFQSVLGEPAQRLWQAMQLGAMRSAIASRSVVTPSIDSSR